MIASEIQYYLAPDEVERFKATTDHLDSYVRALCEPPPASGKASPANVALTRWFAAMGMQRRAQDFQKSYGNKLRASKNPQKTRP